MGTDAVRTEDMKLYEALSKIELTDGERRRAAEIADMLIRGFDALAGVYGLDNVEPLVSVLDLENVLREDVAVKLISREELLSGAPAQNDGYFEVPRTLV